MEASFDLVCAEDSLGGFAVQSDDAPSRAPIEITRASRLRTRRPLSPICPYTSVAEIPRRFEGAKRALPWAVSICVHVTLLCCGFVTVETVLERGRIENIVDGALSETPPTIPVIAMPAAIQPINPMEQLAKSEPQPADVTPRDPANAETSLLDRQTTLETHVPRSHAVDEPIVLGVAVREVSLPKPKRAAAMKTAFAAVEAKPVESTAVPFFGVNGNARSVVYLCDASGSMMGTDATIATQLQRAVLSLAPTQQFDVVFFSDGAAPIAFSPTRLLAADANNKLAACNFARQFSCHGKTNAMPALRAALKFRPDVVYLVTDGALEDSDERDVLAAIRSANRDRATQINVIFISGAAQVDPDDLKFLTSVATETGGTCRVVNPNSM